jgi:hypothetical protein
VPKEGVVDLAQSISDYIAGRAHVQRWAGGAGQNRRASGKLTGVKQQANMFMT